MLHHVTIDLLRWSFYQLKRRAAAGIDGVTWDQLPHWAPTLGHHSVGTPDHQLFAAQYSARVFPYQRFTSTLTDASA
jgi:hypothetical protein